MKRILTIEIVGPSSYPLVVNEKTDRIPDGTRIRLEIIEGLWEGAVWSGKIVHSEEKQ